MSEPPHLQSYARVLRRGADSVQVGPVGHGVVLSGLRLADLAFLEDLETSRWAQAVRRPRRPTFAALADGCTDLIDTLRRQHLLAEPTPPHVRQPRGLDADAAARSFAYQLPSDGHDVIAARRRKWVLIDGSGRLPDELGCSLREGAVGRVTVGSSAADEAELQMRAHRGPTPDLVILLRSGSVPFTCAEVWRGRNIAHLPVVLDGPAVSVGPLVSGVGPCLGCLDLHRADRDPAWPTMLRQLSTPRFGAEELDLESSLRALTNGLVAAAVYAHLDGRQAPSGHAVDAALPLPTITHRQWSVHPRCRCAAAQVTMEP